MRRLVLLPLLALLLAARMVTAASVGILIEKTSELYAAPVNGFKGAIGESVTELNMEDNPANGKGLCQKMKADGCKLVFAVGKNAAKVAAEELPGIPVVFSMVMNPEEAGLKGKNVTGVSLNIPVARQFEAFKSSVPTLKRVGLVYSDAVSASLAKEMRDASKAKGLTLVEKKVTADGEVPNAIRELKGQIDGLYLPPDRVVANHDAFQFIALFTFENNLPFMAPTDRFVQKGALIALMIDYEDAGKQAAEIAKKILGGASASSVPIESPRATILVLNQKTAQTIGINIPPSLLESSKIIK